MVQHLFHHICIGLFGVYSDIHIGIQSRDHRFTGKQLQVGLDQIFDGIIFGHHFRPGAGTVGRILAGYKVVKPDVCMAVNEGVRQEVFQVFFINE